MRIAILVDRRYVGNHANPDDITLQGALLNKGIPSQIVAWDDVRIDYRSFTHAVIRSCWDYDEKVVQFLERMKYISSLCQLVNPYETILKNHDKRYLLELERRGVNIVPFTIVDADFALSQFQHFDKLIVKPTVSASGKNTYRIDATDAAAIAAAIDEIQSIGKCAIVQKYIDSVETYGERSAVVIGDSVRYAMKKTPAKGGFLVHEYVGGSYRKTALKSDELAFIDDLISKIDDRYLYMRVDFLRDCSGKIMLLELEMIEPGLYMSKAPQIAESFLEELLKRW